MARAFVAIRPPPSVLDAIEARLAAVKLGNGRASRRAQWHLTLQFLGDDVDVEAVARSLIASRFAAGTGRLRLGGAETIGNPRRARLVILGLAEGDTWLGALAAEVAQRLAPIGYGREPHRQEFLPHLTLVRHRTD